MDKKEHYATRLRQKAEQQLKNTSPNDFNEKEMNILKLQHELEVYHIELQMQYDELVNTTVKRDELADELVLINKELMTQLEEKDKITRELFKKSDELLQLNSHQTNREIKIMRLESELKELLRKRD